MLIILYEHHHSNVIISFTWVVLHHDGGHASVSRMAGIVALPKRISMHVMQVGLVLC